MTPGIRTRDATLRLWSSLVIGRAMGVSPLHSHAVLPAPFCGSLCVVGGNQQCEETERKRHPLSHTLYPFQCLKEHTCAVGGLGLTSFM